ncbi:DUF4179 domain-containing protein [Subdoligranulum sp. AM23-21AC]|nr:DUF4179 domain-containing protein [Subdoligranulum sp. AM23-21AC]
MKEKRLLKLLGSIDEKYIDEAKPSYSNEHQYVSTRRFRRIPAALVAAVIAVSLMGVVAVAAVYGSNIQNWFAHQWEVLTGQSMSESQMAVIDHLSQTINASQTVDDVTITVDSATVGDDSFFLLLKVNGIDFSGKNSYDFQNAELQPEPDPLTLGAFTGYQIDYLGIDEAGNALLLVNYSYVGGEAETNNTQLLQVRLLLRDLTENAHTNSEKVICEGTWNFNFTVDRSQTVEKVILPNTEVSAQNTAGNKETTVELMNIELTNMGVRFQYDYAQEDLFLSEERVVLVLKNGKTVINTGAMGSPTDDNQFMQYTYQWLVPVNLDEVDHLEIGTAQIALP